jgi:hypothetical protein
LCPAAPAAIKKPQSPGNPRAVVRQYIVSPLVCAQY